MRFLYLIPLTLSILILANIANAETIEMKDGKIIEAKIISFSDEGVKIENSDQIQILASTDISKINGRSLTADLTIIGLQNQIPEQKKQNFSEWLTNIQKTFNTKKTSSLSDIKKNIENSFRAKFFSQQHSGHSQKLPDWFWPTTISLTIFLYFLFCLPYCMMAEKIGLSVGWQILTIIPILQLFAWVKIADKPLWMTLLLFIPLINIIMFVAIFCGMAKRCGKGSALGLLILVPVINIFFPWYLALNAQRPAPLAKDSQTPMMGQPKVEKRYAITPFEDESKKS